MNTPKKHKDQLTSANVANQVGVSSKTLMQWYKFYESDLPKPKDMPKLPAYEQDYPRAPRYWYPKDVEQIIAFKEWIPRGKKGIMGEINITCWTKAYQERRKAKKQEELKNLAISAELGEHIYSDAEKMETEKIIKEIVNLGK